MHHPQDTSEREQGTHDQDASRRRPRNLRAASSLPRLPPAALLFSFPGETMNETHIQIRSALRRLHSTHKLLDRDETAKIAQLLAVPIDEVINS